MPRPLSPELAKDNPELFRSRLLDSLHDETAVTGLVWDALVRRGQTDPKKLSLDKNGWVSESHATAGTIRIGARSMGDQLRKEVIFEDNCFSGELVYLYRTSHEISHLVHPKIFGLFNYKGVTKHTKSIDFMNTLLHMRKAGIGMSALGNLDFYKASGPDVQAVEDHVELMNMFSIDPAYLERYLAFLADPRHESYRKQQKLITLDKGTVKHTFENIKESLEFFLDDDNEPK
jgi:hypothetical protein